MMTAQMTIPSTEEAQRFSRVLEPKDRLAGILMNPRSGNRTVVLESIGATASFLRPVAFEDVMQMGMKSDVTYVDLPGLARWTREVVGDAVLADRLDEVVAEGEPFGVALFAAKHALDGRLAEYADVLGVDTEDAAEE